MASYIWANRDIGQLLVNGFFNRSNYSRARKFVEKALKTLQGIQSKCTPEPMFSVKFYATP